MTSCPRPSAESRPPGCSSMLCAVMSMRPAAREPSPGGAFDPNGWMAHATGGGLRQLRRLELHVRHLLHLGKRPKNGTVLNTQDAWHAQTHILNMQCRS